MLVSAHRTSFFYGLLAYSLTLMSFWSFLCQNGLAMTLFASKQHGMNTILITRYRQVKTLAEVW